MEQPAKLIVVAGPDTGHVFELSPGAVKLGRKAELTLGDGTVSRVQLAIRATDAGTVTIEHLSRTGATRVNDETVDGLRTLRHGDRIIVGQTELLFAGSVGGGDGADSSMATRQALESDLIVGTSQPIAALKRMIAKVAPSDAAVLIRGETGTGKELVARSVHMLSARADGRFVAVNCAAIGPEGLVDDALFGHEKGAFAGATERRQGELELAHDGTIFLDELGEMPLGVQAKLLRVLEDGSFKRLGGSKELHTNARVIAATNRDLAKAVAEGTFRADLLYRLDVVALDVPPLRERPDDVRWLADHFTRKSRRRGLRTSGFSDEALARLAAHDWPGNVRELRNEVERALIFAEGPSIGVEDLSPKVQGTATAETPPPRSEPDGEREGGRPKSFGDVERDHLMRVLAYTSGNISRAAEIWPTGRNVLMDKIRRHDLVDFLERCRKGEIELSG